MLIGDSFTEGSSQKLTCFDIIGETGTQVVGGSSRSMNVASSEFKELYGIDRNEVDVVFLASFDLVGQVNWNKQYFPANENDHSFLDSIHSCRISSDS
mmetsp:Transcript_43902/g.42429  ORF Transcript_43902/g.42429 Transcript_43902/m.42429 type:complete len:98 (-) Transcript_43902:746-1039(-)